MKKKYMWQRMTKKEKKQALKDVRMHEQKEYHTNPEKDAYEFTLACLRTDHESRLRSKLRHIARFQMLDMSQGNTTDSDYHMSTYLGMYDDESITAILAEIKEAQTALKWLRGLVEAEQKERSEKERRNTQGGSCDIPDILGDLPFA